MKVDRVMSALVMYFLLHNINSIVCHFEEFDSRKIKIQQNLQQTLFANQQRELWRKHLQTIKPHINQKSLNIIVSSATQAKQFKRMTLFPAKRHSQMWFVKKYSHSWLLQMLTILGIPILTTVLMIPSGIKSIFYLMQIANNFGMLQMLPNGTMHLIIPLVPLNATRHST